MFPLQTIVVPSLIRHRHKSQTETTSKIDKIVKSNEEALFMLLRDAGVSDSSQDDIIKFIEKTCAILAVKRFPIYSVYVPIGSLIGYCSGGPYLGSRIRHTSLLLNHFGDTMHAFNGDTLRMMNDRSFSLAKVYGFVYPKKPLFFVIYRKVRRELIKKHDTCFEYISNIFTSEARTLVHPFKRCILKEGKETTTPSPFDQMMRFRNMLTSEECPQQKLPVVCSTFLFYLYLVILFEMMIFTSNRTILKSMEFDPEIINQFNQKYNWNVGRCWPFHIREMATVYPDEFGFQLVDEYLEYFEK